MPWHIAGIFRPLPVSRVLSEEPRKTGCSFTLSVVNSVFALIQPLEQGFRGRGGRYCVLD